MNVAHTILAQGSDDSIALLHGDLRLSYRELRQTVAALADQLLTRGLAKGERIGLCAENSPWSVAAYFGIIRAGLVSVPLPTDLTEESFLALVSAVQLRHLFVSLPVRRRLTPWAEKAGVALLPLPVSVPPANPTPTADPAPVDAASDLATLMLTSGSTGAPKAVMITHRNIATNTADIGSYLGLSASDRAMVVLPFHYCFGLSVLHTLLHAGGSLVLNTSFKLYPETVLQELQQHRCTGIAGVPSTYQLLLRKSRFREMPFPDLRWIQQAGGKLPTPYIREITTAFPSVQFFLMYGQTEATARLSYLPPDQLWAKPGSIGRGLPSTRLSVLLPDGRPVTPGSGEVGEVVAEGHNISPGYWNDPEETARFFRGGRLHTGDLAQVDADGYLFLVDRVRDFIKSGGNRVSALEIEEVIAGLPDIVSVAVVGAPHALLGEAIVAFTVLVPDSQLTAEAVLAHCHRHLPGYKMPAEIRLVPHLPQNESGKILKPKLRELLASEAQ